MFIQLYNSNIRDKLKQFGIKGFLKRSVFAFIRPIYQKKDFIIMVNENHKQNDYPKNENIFLITKSLLTDLKKANGITRNCLNVIEKLLTDGCTGYCFVKNNRLAGHGFIQSKGCYCYVRNGAFHLPVDTMIFRNLYVLPEYRGKAIGKKITQHAISLMPKCILPIVFVVPDNKYAIRNFTNIGFNKILRITVVSWCNKKSYQKQSALNIKKENSELPLERIRNGFIVY